MNFAGKNRTTVQVTLLGLRKAFEKTSLYGCFSSRFWVNCDTVNTQIQEILNVLICWWQHKSGSCALLKVGKFPVKIFTETN